MSRSCFCFGEHRILLAKNDVFPKPGLKSGTVNIPWREEIK